MKGKPAPPPLIDFNTILKVPETHIWTIHPPAAAASKTPTGESVIPIIDMTHPNVHTLIRKACEKWGLFQVTNHGISIDVIHRAEYQIRSLFALPATQKIQASTSQVLSGGYGQAQLSKFYIKKMWHESFTIRGSPDKYATILWPPHQSNLFCEVIEEYEKEIRGLIERLIGLMLESLGLTKEDANFLSGTESKVSPDIHVLQLNHYPVCPNPNIAMGMAPHTDSSLVTLLNPGGVSGLQVFGDGIGWVPVDPVDGGLVVNIGDLMHIFTNGNFISAKHQVAVNNTHDRISNAYFYGPPPEVKIAPSIKLVDMEHPPLYRPVTWNEYLALKGAKFDKALDHLKYEDDDALVTSQDK